MLIGPPPPPPASLETGILGIPLQSEVKDVFSGQAIAADVIRGMTQTAARIDLLAVRGLGLLGLNDSLLRSIVTARTTALDMRVLLLHPDSEAIARRATEIGESC